MAAPVEMGEPWQKNRREELEFYTDMAMNECQRWLQGMSREVFMDEDDFLGSIREGKQLQKLLHKLFIGDLLPDYESRNMIETRDFPPDRHETEIRPNDKWTQAFIRVCSSQLGLRPEKIFRVDDLEDTPTLSDDGRLALDTLHKIRRVVVTVTELARIAEQQPGLFGPKLDGSAVDPILRYHQWLYETGLETTFTQTDLQTYVSEEVKDLIDQLVNRLCQSEEEAVSPPLVSDSSTSGFTGDEAFSYPPKPAAPDPGMELEVNEKVSKYLADLPAENGVISEADRSSCGPFSTRSSSPADLDQRAAKSTGEIATRAYGKSAGPAIHNPLQFVAVRNANPLAHKAHEQLRRADQLKKWKMEAIEVKQEQVVDEDWVSSLDQWKMKRKASSTLLSKFEDEIRPKPLHLITNSHRASAELDQSSSAVEVKKVPHSNSSPAMIYECTKSTTGSSSRMTRKWKELADMGMDDSGHFGAESDDLNHSEHSRQSSTELEDASLKLPTSRPPIEDHMEVPIGKLSLSAEPTPTNFQKQSPTDSKGDVRDSGVEFNRDSSLEDLGHSRDYGLSSKVSENGARVPLPYARREQPIKSPVETRILRQTNPGVTGLYSPAVLTEAFNTTTAAASNQGSLKWKYQEKDSKKTYEDLRLTVEAKPNSEKGFGFTIKGGKDKKAAVSVDGVILGSAADKSRLQVGDEILAINGEIVSDKYQAKINMIIKESLKLGEIELDVRRCHFGGRPNLLEACPSKDPPSPRLRASFDQKRSVFDQEPSIEQPRSPSISNKTRRWSEQPVSRSGSSTPSTPSSRPPSTTIPVNSAQMLQNEWEQRISPPLNRRRQPGRIENFVPEVERDSSPSPKPDYKVVSVHNVRSPGRILDFVPESERSSSSPDVSSGVPSPRPYAEADTHWKKEEEFIRRASSPQNSGSSVCSGEVGGKPYAAPNNLLSPSPYHLTVNTRSNSLGGSSSGRPDSSSSRLSPASSRLTSPPSSGECKSATERILHRQPELLHETMETTGTPHAEPARVDGIGSGARDFLEEKLCRIRQSRLIREQNRDAKLQFFGITKQDSDTDIANEDARSAIETCHSWDEEEKICETVERLLASPSDDFFFEGPTEFAYEISQPPRPPSKKGHRVARRVWAQPAAHRSVLVVPIRDSKPECGTQNSQREPEADDLEIAGDANLSPRPFSHVKKEMVFSNEPLPGEKRPLSNYPSLSQQLRASGIQPATQDMPVNVEPQMSPPKPRPNAINVVPPIQPQPVPTERKTVPPKQQLEPELQYLSFAAQHRDSSEHSAKWGSSASHAMPQTNSNSQDHWLVREAEERRMADQLKNMLLLKKQQKQEQQPETIPYLEEAHHYPVDSYEYDSSPEDNLNNNNGYPPELPKLPPPMGYSEDSMQKQQDQVVSVSGRQQCCHCATELGRGAAMIIESLNLFYHLDCFRCYVCDVSLGSGSQGADVRVRAGKLHCQSCYSNDEVGLKFSEV